MTANIPMKKPSRIAGSWARTASAIIQTLTYKISTGLEPYQVAADNHIYSIFMGSALRILYSFHRFELKDENDDAQGVH
jgi:hypothetical protein